mmetsp:Transcript_29351/g.51514  ORF Transcript_29351/g.51514 Transcript_29351/m.51514 type:complete len:97 (+) Transcript_29351:613-903(+)
MSSAIPQFRVDSHDMHTPHVGYSGIVLCVTHRIQASGGRDRKVEGNDISWNATFPERLAIRCREKSKNATIAEIVRYGCGEIGRFDCEEGCRVRDT